MGLPEQFITPKKQEHMVACAEHYAADNEIEVWQIDVISIEGKPGIKSTITYFESAILSVKEFFMTLSDNLPPTSTYYELLNVCADPGCPICHVGAYTVKRYQNSIFNEFVNDRAIHNNLLKSLGFCREHSQLLLNTRIADALGASIIYENNVKKELRELPRQNKAKDIKNVVNRTKNCMACQQQNTVIDRSVSEISNSLNDEKTQQALQDSDGLCFPHLLHVLENNHNANNSDFLCH